jgi:hypothetical protein
MKDGVRSFRRSASRSHKYRSPASGIAALCRAHQLTVRSTSWARATKASPGHRLLRAVHNRTGRISSCANSRSRSSVTSDDRASRTRRYPARRSAWLRINRVMRSLSPRPVSFLHSPRCTTASTAMTRDCRAACVAWETR